LLFRVPPLTFECAPLDFPLVSFQKNLKWMAIGPAGITRLVLAFCVGTFFLASNAIGLPQSNPEAPRTPKLPQKSSSDRPQDAALQLQKRLDRAERAKASKDPAAVAHASELVIALALRELGQVRLLESSYSQAAELYGRSLDFESTPDTRVDLAIARLQARQFDEAIAEADRALLDDPNNARAFQVLGQAWTRKNDYVRAWHALARAAEISPSIENLYTLAIALLATKNPADRAQAERVFGQMVTLAGDTGSIHVMFGRAYRDAGDLPAAIREFQMAIKLDTRTPHAHYFLGLGQLASNEWVATPEVSAEFKKELEFYPADYLANYMMGFVDSGERKYEEANNYLKQAALVNADAPEPWLYLGLNAYALNDMVHAEEYFRKAIVLTGTDEERSNYQIRRAYIDLGRILTNAGKKQEAEIYLGKARGLQQKVLESSQQGMASHFAEEGADAANSAGVVTPPPTDDRDQTALASSANVDPFAQVDPEVLSGANLTEKQKHQADTQEKQLRVVLSQSFSDLATSEAIRKHYDAALGHYQEAEHWDAALPGLMRSLGTAAFRAENYQEAVRGLSIAIVSHPEDSAVRAMLGMAYFGEEKYADAAKTFQPLGERGMQDAAIGYAWAASLARQGDLKQASEVLTEFEQGDRPSDTLLLIGQVWIEIGNYQRAVASLHHALQLTPTLAKAHYFAGQAYIRWEHWKEAAQEFQAELAQNPEDPEAKYNLGFVYLQQSKRAEAEALFQEVLSAHPEHANAQYEMGKILLDRGELKEAINHLEVAGRLNPQADYIHYQLQAAYRKDGRVTEADRELEIYKHLKAEQRSRASASIPQQNP
jgi:tetratricopeptide (TPR) repeat protein